MYLSDCCPQSQIFNFNSICILCTSLLPLDGHEKRLKHVVVLFHISFIHFIVRMCLSEICGNFNGILPIVL